MTHTPEGRKPTAEELARIQEESAERWAAGPGKREKLDPATIRIFVCPNDMFPGVPVYAAKRRVEGGQEHRLKSTGKADQPGVPVCLECGVEAVTYGRD